MKKENLNSIVKMRVTDVEANSIKDFANQNNCTISAVLRNALFNNSSVNEVTMKIRCAIEHDKIYNHIAFMPLDNSTKKRILKEVANIDASANTNHAWSI